MSVVWLPAAKRLVAWGDVADDRAHGSSVLCALDPELRLLHTVDVGALPSARPGGHFDAVALDPDGRFVALWFARLRSASPSSNAYAAIVSWSGATPVRQVAVEGMRGRPEYFGDEFGRPFVHGARWASADRVEFYAERDTARVDPRDGRWVVTEDDHFFGCEEVYCRELADAPEARVTLSIATDRWGLMTPLVYWGLRFDEGAARVGCLLPWPRAVGWRDEEVEVQNHAAHAAGRVALLTGVQGSSDALSVRLVDLRAGRAGMRAAEVATVAGQCGTIELSPDARWVFVTTHGRAGAEECWVFPTGDLAWAPMGP